jgi:outer membrane protein assembly factor BamE
MRPLLIFIAIPAILTLTACSSIDEISNAVPNALDRAALVYRPTIQQGNVVTQEQVNELKPGMSKRQVRFVLGTPMLIDVFHVNRWDYAYTLGVGSKPSEMQRVTVFFENDRLVSISGDLRPQPEEERVEPEQEVVVTVPDWEEPNKSLWRRLVDSIGWGDD